MHSFLNDLDEAQREVLLALSREVTFPAGAHVFAEHQHADRFWLIRTGGVDLELHVPGRRSVVVQSLGGGDLLGWSWLIPPHQWTLGAVTRGPVSALEFDAARVRALCADDHELGYALALGCAAVIGHRLRDTRTRLLDLNAQHGSAPPRPGVPTDL
ncbi:Crp/Fnr family transcriptional regulator [Streptacidiphilus sp. EB129]|uniref:Crp/Fnr family transcriptional regulator n=1 Tax=Streptacidiphilus sp. EB129 TaxID=3156262 RepID=UPI0035184AFD